MNYFILFLSIISFSFSAYSKSEYNLQINIKDGEQTETFNVISEIDNTSFSESIKSPTDSGLNPTKKMTLRKINDVNEIKKPDVVWTLDVQYGTARVESNTTQIPNSEEATEIDLPEGSVDSLRVYLGAIIKEKHEVRLLFAPLKYGATFVPDQDLFFNGVKLLAGEKTDTEYQFNSYRLSYIYHFDRVGRMQYRIGFTGKIRDAYTLLRQDGVESTYDNVGFVPLFHFGVNIILTDRLNLDLETEASWAPQGYAVDSRIILNFNVAKNIQIGAGVGFLDGGADTDSVNTFATILFGFARVKVVF